MSKKIFFDIDGTLDLCPWCCWNHDDIHPPVMNPNINPERVKFIITGRPECVRELTLIRLKKMGITPKILLMNPLMIHESKHIYNFKANYLRAVYADVYVDEDPRWKFEFPKYWNGIVIDSTELGAYL